MSDQPAHYRLSPSSSKRWLNCPGSAQNNLPDRETDASREGTLAHAMGYSWLTHTPLDSEQQAELKKLTQEQQHEMEDFVEVYTDFVVDLPGEKRYEVKLASKTIPDFGGTIDTLRIDGDLLHTVDLKYGFGRVYAEDNKQLLSYLCLAREYFPKVKRFSGTIVQPRLQNGLIDTAEFTKEQLDEHLIAVMEASESDEFVAGDWCQWCPLLINCDVAYRKTMEIADTEFEVIGTNVDRLKAILEFGEVVAEKVKLAREKLLELIKSGQIVAGYKAAQKLGNRKWRDEGVVISTLRRRYPQQFDNFIKLKTPAQIEKVVPKSVLEDLDLYHRQLGDVYLTSDKSPSQGIDFESEFE